MPESMIKIKVIKTKRETGREGETGRGRGTVLCVAADVEEAVAIASCKLPQINTLITPRTDHQHEHATSNTSSSSPSGTGDTSATGHKNGSSMQHN